MNHLFSKLGTLMLMFGATLNARAQEVRVWNFEEVQRDKTIYASVHLKGSVVDFAQFRIDCTSEKECVYFSKIQECFQFNQSISSTVGNESVSFQGKTFEYISGLSRRTFSQLKGSIVFSRLGPKTVEAKTIFPKVNSWIETESHIASDERDPFTPDPHPAMNAWRKWIDPDVRNFGGVLYDGVDTLELVKADEIKKSCKSYIE